MRRVIAVIGVESPDGSSVGQDKVEGEAGARAEVLAVSRAEEGDRFYMRALVAHPACMFPKCDRMRA